MRALKFDIEGDFAFFKKPDVNDSTYFTYSNIHSVAIKGLIGACVGYGGYAEQKGANYPEFYSKLEDVKVSIVPKNENGYVEKIVNVYNNSTGNASSEKGGNLIVREQVLIKPKWTIYVELDGSSVSKDIEDAFVSYAFKFIPYLGKNDYMAEISGVAIVNLEVANNSNTVNSLYIEKDFEVKKEALRRGSVVGKTYYCLEHLPSGLLLDTNTYILTKYVHTNKKIVKVNTDTNIYKDVENNICLYFI